MQKIPDKSSVVAKKAAHTPGPYVVQEDGGICEVIAKGPHRHLAIARVWFTDLIEGSANAHLFSASPDLLSAAKHALAALENPDDVDAQDAIDALGRAIAKAEGRGQ